jgi:hypothetical protein
MRFRGRTVIDAAVNVEIQLILLQFPERDDSRIIIKVLSGSIDLSDRLNVFRLKRALVLAFPEFSIRIDEQHVLAFGGSIPVDYQHTGRNIGAVEQIARQASHGFRNTVLDELLRIRDS